MRPILMKGHDGPLSFLMYYREGDILFSCAKDHNPTLWFNSLNKNLRGRLLVLKDKLRRRNFPRATKPRWGDLDVNQHVNNVKYIGWILESEVYQLKELVILIEILNPENIPGRITIITRMGAENMRVKLPHLIRADRGAGQIITWVSDPMHGNTIKVPCGLKTCPFDAILVEVMEMQKNQGCSEVANPKVHSGPLKILEEEKHHSLLPGRRVYWLYFFPNPNP